VCVCVCECQGAYKDVALLSLANVLHRARHPAEAAIVAHAGLQLSPSLYVHHFTLGNIYAVRVAHLSLSIYYVLQSVGWTFWFFFFNFLSGRFL
jgi:hypothetical protein